MTTENNIDRLYRKASNAVNRLSVADNHWTFEQVPGQYFWWCINHGHKEALLKVHFESTGRLSFRVIDTGLVRFVDGSSVFQFNMQNELDDAAEDEFLDTHLIHALNVKHGITVASTTTTTTDTAITTDTTTTEDPEQDEESG